MNGIIPLYKPRGMTSADCVYKLRKILHEKKIGHTGTLDPEVDGVLVICVGQATKLVDLLMNSHKIYQGKMVLGKATTTEDATGEVVDSQPVYKPYNNEEIETALQSLTGVIEQQPPMFSAVKVNGKRLYEYARAGQTVERPIRQIEIYRFEQTANSVFDADKQEQVISFEVECSKGTYIRTLSLQVGQQLQIPAHMSELTRTMGGGFTLQQTMTLEQVTTQMEADKTDFLVPLTQVFAQLPQHELDSQQWQIVQNGGRLSLPNRQSQVALTHQGIVKAIYKAQTGFYAPDLMLLKNDR